MRSVSWAFHPECLPSFSALCFGGFRFCRPLILQFYNVVGLSSRRHPISCTFELVDLHCSGPSVSLAFDLSKTSIVRAFDLVDIRTRGPLTSGASNLVGTRSCGPLNFHYCVPQSRWPSVLLCLSFCWLSILWAFDNVSLQSRGRLISWASDLVGFRFVFRPSVLGGLDLVCLQSSVLLVFDLCESLILRAYNLCGATIFVSIVGLWPPGHLILWGFRLIVFKFYIIYIHYDLFSLSM